jgi:hypothetical protein
MNNKVLKEDFKVVISKIRKEYSEIHRVKKIKEEDQEYLMKVLLLIVKIQCFREVTIVAHLIMNHQ